MSQCTYSISLAWNIICSMSSARSLIHSRFFPTYTTPSCDSPSTRTPWNSSNAVIPNCCPFPSSAQTECRSIRSQLEQNSALNFPPVKHISINCSPFLAPVFILNSRITNVYFDWQEWDMVDDATLKAIMALTRSSATVLTVSYESKSWNIEFIRLASTYLNGLYVLHLFNDRNPWLSGVDEEEIMAWLCGAQ